MVKANLDPEGSARPDAILSSSVHELWAPRHDQGEIGPGGPTLCDHRTPCLPNPVRARSTAVPLVLTGYRPAASNDSDSFISKKKGLHWLEKILRFKKPYISVVLSFSESVSFAGIH